MFVCDRKELLVMDIGGQESVNQNLGMAPRGMVGRK